MSRTDLRQHTAECTSISPGPPEPMPKVQLKYPDIKDRAAPLDALAAASSSAALLATAEPGALKRVCAAH